MFIQIFTNPKYSAKHCEEGDLENSRPLARGAQSRDMANK